MTGGGVLAPPSPFSRLTREISEGAQLSKFAPPSLAQPSCSPPRLLLTLIPARMTQLPRKLPIETGKARCRANDVGGSC
jgi:hypothetical protein